MNNKNKTTDEHYTKTPSVLVFQLKDQPITMTLLQYILLRKGVERGWKFRIADMATQMNWAEKTVRKYIKPLLAVDLLTLKGEIGKQYYAFNTEVYRKLLRIDPFQTLVPVPQEGTSPVPYEGTSLVPQEGTRRVPRDGRVQIKEEQIRELEIKENREATCDLSSPVMDADKSPLRSTDNSLNVFAVTTTTSVPETYYKEHKSLSSLVAFCNNVPKELQSTQSVTTTTTDTNHSNGENNHLSECSDRPGSGNSPQTKPETPTPERKVKGDDVLPEVAAERDVIFQRLRKDALKNGHPVDEAGLRRVARDKWMIGVR